MPGIGQIRIKSIKRSDGNQIKSEIRQAIQDEFQLQLGDAANRFGNPAFCRDVEIVIQSNHPGNSFRGFNSCDSTLWFEDYCVDPNAPTYPWNLKDALSHEIVHLIIGNKHGVPMRPEPLVMEEGLAAYNCNKVASSIPTMGYKDAVKTIEDALTENSDLFTIWRNQGDAPVVQTLVESHLKGWGLSKGVRDRLLADFVL